MALTCDAFTGGTVTLADAACTLNNNSSCPPSQTLEWWQIAILAINALDRAGLAHVVEMNSEEAETVVQNALCAIGDVSVPPMDEARLKAALLYAVNEAVCSVL